MLKKFQVVFVLMMILVIALPVRAAPLAADDGLVNFTILHTNDFHGQLELSGSNPGAARVATMIKSIRTTKAALGQDVLLFDAGDISQGSLLSNLQKGLPTIDYYKTIGYDAATFGNHEFDWGQTVLTDRVNQAKTDDSDPTTKEFNFLAANITTKVGDSCAGWDLPAFIPAAYQVFTVHDADGGTDLRVGVIGVSSIETPYITIAEATAGLCFKTPYESILHYYDELDAASDVIVVISHNGYTDGGYGYGFPVEGDQTLATKLLNAGKPAQLIIGGHSHTNLASATVVTVGSASTTVVQAHYNGRRVGQADFVYTRATGGVAINWVSNAVSTTSAEDAEIKALVTSYASDPAYHALINTPIFYTAVPITRNYDGNGLMGEMVNDSVYGVLNNDADGTNDVDMVFNNAGGLRADITCTSYPCLVNYGMTFTVLPFGNATAVGEMTGAQIVDLLNQSATLFKGALQVSGVRYKFYRYTKTDPACNASANYVYAWGAYDIKVYDKATSSWVAIDPGKTYKVATNEFLAPAGQDGFTPFKYMANITYWGDMLDQVNAWMSAHYPVATPYLRYPDGRITRDGTDAGGSIIPITILHHNDSHGNLVKTSYVGYTQLATLIKQERACNPDRNLLLTAGDNIQGDAMMYYYKSAPLGYTADGTPLPAGMDADHPLIKAFNYMNYDGMTLGNHEFNFGSEIFKAVMGEAEFPVLQANIYESSATPYGLATVGVQPYTIKSVGPEGIDVAILGIGNHRIPNYELPSNIPGLGFLNPVSTASYYAPALANYYDAVVALTHIGFTENPSSVEVDTNVDTYLATQAAGIDAIIGGHSHTDPSKQTDYSGIYKYLPTVLPGPNKAPVLVTTAYRYNNTLGVVVLGMRSNGAGGYEVASRAGKYLSVSSSTVEDPELKTILQPYVDGLTAYNNTVLGQTTEPIDALEAYTQETNGANLQADAAVAELASNGITVDFHLSGAMSNRKVADAATPAAPVTLKVSDMFALMPYENSLVVVSMNGPQIKAVLERGYRNYFYYKYYNNANPKWAGYSHYTTCMLDTNAGGKIVYRDTSPTLPDGNNVVAMYYTDATGVIQQVDFADAATYYDVSTVNYLAAGSCNFNDSGVTLWPLDQIVHDTQYYVRDAVINYVDAETEGGVPISPVVEGRLVFSPDLVAMNDGETTDEETLVQVDVLANDDYAGTGELTVGIGANPAHGTVVVNADDTINYTPALNYNGTDQFTYSVSDGTLTTIGVVYVEVTPINDAPVCQNLTMGAVPGVAATSDPICTDVDSPVLTYEIVAQPTNGTAEVLTGKLVFTPGIGFTGTDSFTYRAYDSSLYSTDATVTVAGHLVHLPLVMR